MHRCKIIFLVFICCAQTSYAQIIDVPGHLKNYSGKQGPPDLLNYQNLPLQPMKTTLLRFTEITESAAHFGEPKGYDLYVRLSMSSPEYTYPYVGFTWMAIHEFYRNDKGEIEVDPETGAGVTIYVNDLRRLLPDGGNAEMDELEVPRFVRAPIAPVTTDAQGYLHLQDGEVVLTNGKPIFIPYTQEQYLTYLTRQKQKIVKLQQDNKRQFASFANKEQLQQFDKAVNDAEDALRAVQLQLKSMTAGEKKKPAYIYFTLGKDLANSDPSKLMQLTAPDDPYAEALITTNPAYFNTALPKSAVQLIAVVPETDASFMDLVKRVMEEIDYGRLKAFIQ